MTSENDIIVIDSDDLPPEQPADIVIDLEDLPDEAPAVLNQNVDFVIEIPDIPCAICHSAINPGEVFGKCKICETPYHKECWDFNGGCAVLGCRGANNKRGFQIAKKL
jgi:hypothetical protein